MKNQKKGAIAFKDADAALIEMVETVIAERAKSTFSVSRIYNSHNAVFQLSEPHQSCGSCLRRRADNLKKWYDDAQGGKTAKLTTGDKEKAEATTYEGVIAKYGLVITGGEASELATLTTLVEESAPLLGLTPNELALVNARYIALVDKFDGEELTAFYAAHEQRLAELGVHAESSDEEVLQALELLNSDTENSTDEEREHYVAQIAIVKQRIEDAAKGEFKTANQGATGVTRFAIEGVQAIDFTATEGNKGTVKHEDGSAVKTGTYDLADGRKLAVSVGGKAAIKDA